MEIVHLIDETWQLTNESGTVLMQDTYDTCLDRLCELENKQYLDFLKMSGI